MKKVLVTGSEGYIGSVLMPILHGAGYDVVGMDTMWFSDGRLIPFERSWPVIQKDVRDVDRNDLTDFSAIVHLAALSNDHVGALDADLTFDVNYWGTVRLAELAREMGIERFIYSSSCSMYGVADDGAVNESAPFRPQTAYAKSKVEAERELQHLANDRFSPVYLRNATAFGISPRQRFDLVLPNLSGYAHTTGEIKILSDGTPWRPLVHIRDIAHAVLCCLNADREAIHNEAFNIGSNDQNYQIKQLAETVQQVFSDCHLTFGPPPEQADTRSYCVDFTKATTQLPEFSTSWTVVRGVRECADAFAKVQLTYDSFCDRLYTRLKQLEYLMSSGMLNERLKWNTPISHSYIPAN